MPIEVRRLIFAAVLGLVCPNTLIPARAEEATVLKFDLGSGAVEPGYTQVLSLTTYTAQRGYGFEPGTRIQTISRVTAGAISADFCTAEGPFYFSATVPEGNYRVTVTLGDIEGESNTTVKAELRRLMLENVGTSKGQLLKRSFVVNVRRPEIPGGDRVRLKDREKRDEMWAWDEKLTLEFNGKRPCVSLIEVQKVEVPTVYLMGDSTVCDQPREPWNSWGQMLPRWFDDRVVVANHANSGESLRSSLSAKRLDKVVSQMKAGDYLFIQFGHNDMKQTGEGVGAFTSYTTDLKHFITKAREKGGQVVLVTSCERKAGVNQDTLGDYPEAVRRVAKEENLPLIDLHAMSKTLYHALGPDIDKAFNDGTHHNNYGSYELAKCIVEGIRQNKLPLAKHIVSEFRGFKPARPDPVEGFHIAPSTQASTTTPLGS